MLEKLPTRVGIFAKDLCGSSFDVRDSILQARQHGMKGTFIGTAIKASSTLDQGELEDIRKLAQESGITLGLGIGMLNPYRPERSSEALEVGNGDLAKGLLTLTEAALALGQPNVMLVVGKEEDRFNRSVTWSVQLEEVSYFLKRLEPDLRSLGARVLIKTHEEITSWEVRRLLEVLDPDLFGAAFDPVNLIVRMEDPIAAADRLAGRIGQVHVDDARLLWSGRGYSRLLCPVGEGCIDWTGLISRISASDPDAWYWGEIHRAELDVPFRNEGWFDFHPDIEISELAAWISKGRPLTGAPLSLVGDIEERVREVASFLARQVIYG
ncbi:sugar phosphate isomerase/epimerase family protein [Brevibacillus choshinensis]|uniref:Sugar phosphate isomerase/epimerase n=1 Tax=Brevibacillus choshinensis TaxID=54911 RepID=A0ABX7FVL6_BRECH|nr:sugar phosphate isomerase/epimerase [Brevibacillus choshinensis]QRG70294.1 sugar phosphate isomerase/epimerase [Brevibacillus choshinensis]